MFINNIKTVIEGSNFEADRGEIVSNVLYIAGFALIAIALVNWLGTAILNKAADTASCIEGSNTYNSAESAKNCSEQNHAGKNSYQNDQSYQDRFGSK